MIDLPRGKRSAIVRLHNKGWMLNRISEHVGFPADVVEKFLKTRQGYPGKIPCPRAEQARRSKKDAIGYIEPKTRRDKRNVSLPRLSFLEKAEN